MGSARPALCCARLTQHDARRSGNLLIANLHDVLTEEVVAKATGGMSVADLFVHTDYLTTVVVVVPKCAARRALRGPPCAS